VDRLETGGFCGTLETLLSSEVRMKVLVCGSRNWTNVAAIRRELSKLPKDSEIVHGGARGADRIAGKIASELGLQVSVFYADWERHGRAAGFVRNGQMIDYGPDLVLAFSEDLSQSHGTADTVRRAQSSRIETRIFDG
jgi:hypothetical protein